MITTIWIWVISLVVRVINEAVENLSNSELEKSWTLSKTFLRRSRASPAAVLEDKKPTRMVQVMESKVNNSMSMPVLRM